jgi:hypothetical protein
MPHAYLPRLPRWASAQQSIVGSSLDFASGAARAMILNLTCLLGHPDHEMTLIRRTLLRLQELAYIRTRVLERLAKP